MLAEKVVVVNGDFMDLCRAWGKEDALKGEDMQGSTYFVGAHLKAYNAGYADGLSLRAQVEGPSDELVFMAGVLESLRVETGRPAECALADQWLSR